ncbi:FHA domain-containing protein [Ktedonosporobacter rubrisoli]|uniref:FHA domain-containing protein n=1 Tax=Ktedonosporobacter rubrisoli TaxID=2509675 RepID=A0A4V0YZX6_KTERU|nr:FHA domain-containing protein [Ktedonosporobacter rubrisoli]QBD81251.1 FHA domain-containing protein [Ktedonosporobacter rubrisoli]
MDARFYNSEELDIERLADDLVNAYISQGYQAQKVGSRDQILVQLRKGGDFEAILGLQAALSVTLQRTAGGVLAMIGQQRWLDKAAVGAVGIVLPILWPLAVTAGVGAVRQASLGNQALNMLDGLVRQQRPGVMAGPVPYQLLPQMQQQWGAPPSAPTPAYIPPPKGMPMPPQPALPPGPSRLRCANCNTPYEPGDTFCSGCGRSLAPAKLYCSNCHFELKPDASFCPKCGTSTYQTLATTQQTPAQPSTPPSPTIVYSPPAPPEPPAYTPPAPSAPVYTPPATPTYTPPVQQTPAYTPPPTQPAPTYTPPPRPETPVYTPPPAPPKPEPPVYTPPQTQDPPFVPQPKVTIVPAEPRPQTAQSEPKRQEKQYYIPSNQAAQSAAQDATQSASQEATQYYTPPAQSQPHKPKVQTPAQQPAPPKPIQARPASKSASDPNTPWGSLSFQDGTQVQLSGERAVVGRYDHDLGGLHPEVDLASTSGADTISRVHAVLEHIGSAYTLTDLNSTNSTRINGKRLEPDKATPLNDGDTLTFGKVTCTFKKL